MLPAHAGYANQPFGILFPFLFRAYDFLLFKKNLCHQILLIRAKLNWAYEFPGGTGLDIQIFRIGPAGRD